MIRSLLFAGATRPELVLKLPRSAPDACVIDLEDAVPESHKDQARRQVGGLVSQLAAEHPEQAVYVRVNCVASPWFEQDMAQAVLPCLAGIVVPKVERAEDIQTVRAALQACGCTELGVIAGIESARGVHCVEGLLGAPVSGAYFGAEDYIADLGGRRTREGDEVLFARSRVVLACRIAGVIALDQAVVELGDDERFAADARRGAQLGYDGKICIHPRQVALAHEVFGASDAELAWARRVLDAAAVAADDGRGALEVDGAMVDEPALRMARDMLDRAQR